MPIFPYSRLEFAGTLLSMSTKCIILAHHTCKLRFWSKYSDFDWICFGSLHTPTLCEDQIKHLSKMKKFCESVVCHAVWNISMTLNSENCVRNSLWCGKH